MGKVRLLRAWSGVLLAGFLACALLIPTIDTFVCIADADQSVAVSAAQSDSGPSQPAHDDGDSSCIHGHCHHWVGVARLTDRVAHDSVTTDAGLVRTAYSPPASAPQVQLLRPPRA
jgi:hypothetical protein